jgi:hypothetical protein
MSDQQSKTTTLCHGVFYGGYQIDFMSSCKIVIASFTSCRLFTIDILVIAYEALSSVSGTEIIWIYDLFRRLPVQWWSFHPSLYVCFSAEAC